MSICNPATAESWWMFPTKGSDYRPLHRLKRQDQFASVFRWAPSTKLKLLASYSGSMKRGREVVCDLRTCPTRCAIKSESGSVNLGWPRLLSPAPLPQWEWKRCPTESAISYFPRTAPPIQVRRVSHLSCRTHRSREPPAPFLLRPNRFPTRWDSP